MNRVARDRVGALRRGGALKTGVLLVLVVTATVRADTGGATVAESAPINDLLERARRGIERGDWKFVVDSLQRVIEEPQGALTTQDGRVYESARMQAYRQLADLPQPAMEAYHLLHDGEAGRLYEEAVESYDFVKLQLVVDRYLLTQCGDLAAVTLAGWFIDLGKPGPAIAILTDLRNLRRAAGDSAATAAAMMAVAYAQLHRPAHALRQIEKIRLGGDLDETWDNRLGHIAAYVSGSQPRLDADHQSAAADGWPVPFGNNARTGRMPGTTPVLLDGLPWHRDLPPYSSAAPWSAVVERQLETNRLLASHMLVSGNNLYFKTGGRLFSVDLLSIELNWSTARPPTRTTRRSANRILRFNVWSTPQPNTPAAEEARRVDAALSDGVAAAISIAHGLVFELVPEPWDSSNLFRNTVPRIFPPGSMQPRENTLVARKLQARDQVWALGTGFGTSASRPPHEMIFTSTPLAVGTGAGEALLVTYRDGQDFYAGLLDPFDGGIELKRVYLCTMTPGFLDFPDLLPPAADDQFAYIPTNAGLLLAVNLGDLSLRWASRYERRAGAPSASSRRRSASPQSMGPRDRWLAAPPVLAGTAVVLAPADSDHLFAFDRATGHILWKKNRGGHNYIVAVDGPSVWLGGRYLTKVDLATGKSDWQIETPSATGRAVLSGRRVLVPTRDGLLMVNADSGQDAETQPLPPNHAPLGRLLCWDGALYSLDTEQIRKFPDLEQSYEPARARHAADPTDASAAIRLAWMELLRQQPNRVLETLEKVATDDTPQGQRQSAHIAHLRVEALLAGATSNTLSSVEAEARLRRALAIAESAEDRFNAASALADRLVRNRKPVEAYQYVWRTASLDAMSELEQQTTGCKRSMRDTLTDKLAEISASLPDTQKERMAELLFAETALDETPDRQNRRRLEQSWAWLSEGDDLAHWNQRAALQLGRLYQGRRKYEAAEYYYRKANELNLDPQLTAAAASGLAEMYVEQGPEARFASIADGVAAVLPTQPVSEGRLLEIETDQAAEPADLFYVFAPPNNLFAHRFSDGQRLWPTRLRLPTESSLEDETGRATRIQDRPPQAKTDGQILITNTETGLHAVGMITGRRLWSIPIEVPAPQQQHIADGSLFDVRDGKVVVRVSAHQLDVVRVVDGHDRLWSARLQDHIIGSVRIAGDRVIALDHLGTAATVFDLYSGERLFEIATEESDSETDSHLMLYATTLCILENGVLSGYDLKTGEKRWDRPVAFAVTRHFRAADDCGVVGGSEGSVLAFRPDDGAVRYEGRVSSAPFGISGGFADDTTLFLFGPSETDPDSRAHVTALDWETQSVKWANPELGLSFCQKRFFDFLPDHFPVLYRRAQTGRPNVPAFLEQDRAYVVLVDKRTGKRSGEPLLVPLVDRRQDLIGDLLIRPGRIVIGTNGGVHILLLP